MVGGDALPHLADVKRNSLMLAIFGLCPNLKFRPARGRSAECEGGRRKRNEVNLGHLIGWTMIVVTVLIIITTVVHIHKNIGIGTTRGFLWFLAVIIGSLFGVILYRFFRQPIEDTLETMFERF